MIVHNAFTMPVPYHGTILWGTYIRPTSIKTWWGVSGALTLVGRNQTREGVIDATMTNFATRELLDAAAETMDAQTDAGLKGTLIIDGVSYLKCLFLGWEPTAPAFYDGSGQHAWTQMGRLKWQQTR